MTAQQMREVAVNARRWDKAVMRMMPTVDDRGRWLAMCRAASDAFMLAESLEAVAEYLDRIETQP